MRGWAGACVLLEWQKCEGDEATRRHAAPSQEKKKKQNKTNLTLSGKRIAEWPDFVIFLPSKEKRANKKGRNPNGDRKLFLCCSTLFSQTVTRQMFTAKTWL